MPEERFDLLAKNYEAEQAELKQKAETLKANLSATEESEKNITKFIAIVWRQKVQNRRQSCC